MKKFEGIEKVLRVVLVLLVVFVGGFAFGRSLPMGAAASSANVPDYNVAGVEATSVDGVVMRRNPNPCSLTFIFSEPIAPDFYVGYGLGRGYDIFVDNPQKWDPLGIGVDKPMALATAVRNINGVTDDVYAKGYSLTVIIAESHLERRDDLIGTIEETIGDFLAQNG